MSTLSRMRVLFSLFQPSAVDFDFWFDKRLCGLFLFLRLVVLIKIECRGSVLSMV